MLKIEQESKPINQGGNLFERTFEPNGRVINFNKLEQAA